LLFVIVDRLRRDTRAAGLGALAWFWFSDWGWAGVNWGFAERVFFLIDGLGFLAGRLAGEFEVVDDSKEDAFVQGELVDRLAMALGLWLVGLT